MADPFIGEIRMLAFPFAPQGWAFCHGQALPIQQNPALYSILGNTFGSTATTFNVPNMQGRAPMHFGSGPGLTSRSYAEAKGTSSVGLTISNLPSHSHDLLGANISGTTETPSSSVMPAMDSNKGTQNIFYLAQAQSSTTKVAMSPRSLQPFMGGSDLHENRQPLLGMNFCIALDGEYPIRP